VKLLPAALAFFADFHAYPEKMKRRKSPGPPRPATGILACAKTSQAMVASSREMNRFFAMQIGWVMGRTQ